jgi:hypothetical protein
MKGDPVEDKDPSPAEQMIHDLGTDPALDVDADERAELLQKWHRDDDEDLDS